MPRGDGTGPAGLGRGGGRGMGRAAGKGRGRMGGGKLHMPELRSSSHSCYGAAL